MIGGGADFLQSSTWFLVTYGPVILAAVFSLLWSDIDVNIKKLHPFMEMAHPDSSHEISSKSICFTYLDKITYLVPFYSLWQGHTLVFVASCLDVVATILAPLLANSLKLQVFVLSVDGGFLFGRSPAISLTVARVTEALLLCMMSAIGYLIYLLKRKSSAVYSDPTSLASIMAMAHPTVLAVFRELETSTSTGLTSQELDQRLHSLNPRLNHIVDEVTGRTTYQISVDPATVPSSHQPEEMHKRNRLSRWFATLSTSSIPSLVLIIGLIISIPFTAMVTSPDGSTILPFRVITVAFAIILKAVWVAIERGKLHDSLDCSIAVPTRFPRDTPFGTSPSTIYAHRSQKGRLGRANDPSIPRIQPNIGTVRLHLAPIPLHRLVRPRLPHLGDCDTLHKFRDGEYRLGI